MPGDFPPASVSSGMPLPTVPARAEFPLDSNFMVRRVAVSVPATCANLGPGFDCLALALSLRNRFEVTLEPAGADSPSAPCTEVLGAPEDIGRLRTGRDNLFLAAFRRLCQQQGVAMPRIRVRIHVNLPPGRGLGSSATAVVGGLLAANTLLGNPLSDAALLDLAVACEPGHHPDNVAAALYGGMVVTGVRGADERLVTLAYPMPPSLRAVLFIPDLPMSTVRGRSLLPGAYTRADVTFNLSRVALLLAAFSTGKLGLLATAMDDRIHQPYREQLFPGLRPLIAAACEAGAHGACLSGGGSSILALVTERAEAVRAAMEEAAGEHGIPGRGLIAEISPEGAHATLQVPLTPPEREEGDQDA
ncbi:MAG TPA: homoserine kinase [Ktedonobacterales bacterium]|nr:homoserine kinase [Ktedonobacterales bacterium]